MVRLEGRIPDRAESEGLMLFLGAGLVAIGGVAVACAVNSPVTVVAMVGGIGILFRGAYVGVKEIKVSRQFERSAAKQSQRLQDIVKIAELAAEHHGSPFRGGPTVLESLDAIRQLAEDPTLTKSAGPYLFHECGCPVYPRMAEVEDCTIPVAPYPPVKVSQ